MPVYFRQPTKRGEKATRRRGSPRVELTTQGEGPEEEVKRASGQGESNTITSILVLKDFPFFSLSSFTATFFICAFISAPILFFFKCCNNEKFIPEYNGNTMLLYPKIKF